MFEEADGCGSICRDDDCSITRLHKAHDVSEIPTPAVHHRPLVRPPWQQPDPSGLINSIMKATSKTRPKWFQEIAPDVRDDFGNVTDRSIWRGLRKLVDRGHLIRLDIGLAFHAYIRPSKRKIAGRPSSTDDIREYMLSIVEIHPTMRDA